MKFIGLIALAGLAGCASSQGGLLEQSSQQQFHSSKKPGQVAGCVQQSLRNGPVQGTDGERFWITRQNAYGPVVRYDFIPDPSGGTTVEYRSRIKINNGLDKVKACL